MSIDATLNERQSTHGDFPRRAIVEQQLIDIMEGADMWPSFEPFQRSAARMIAVKLSRLLAGNPDHKDSWHDIAGYAKLAEDAINEPCRHETMLSDGKRVQCAVCQTELPIHVV